MRRTITRHDETRKMFLYKQSVPVYISINNESNQFLLYITPICSSFKSADNAVATIIDLYYTTINFTCTVVRFAVFGYISGLSAPGAAGNGRLCAPASDGDALKKLTPGPRQFVPERVVRVKSWQPPRMHHSLSLVFPRRSYSVLHLLHRVISFVIISAIASPPHQHLRYQKNPPPSAFRFRSHSRGPDAIDTCSIVPRLRVCFKL